MRRLLWSSIGMLLLVNVALSWSGEAGDVSQSHLPFRDSGGLLRALGSVGTVSPNYDDVTATAAVRGEMQEQKLHGRVRYANMNEEAGGGDDGVDSDRVRPAYSRWIWPVAAVLVAGGVTYGLYTIRSR